MTHQPTDTPSPAQAAEFFSDLASALLPLPDTERVYAALGRVFARLLDERTASARATLAGQFAKTDYLLQEGRAAAALARGVNDARVRLRRAGRGELGREEAAEWARHDFRALAGFVSFLYGVPVPEGLRAQFPQGRAPRRRGVALGECARMLVRSWDDSHILGVWDDGPRHPARVRYGAPREGEEGFDWSYLKPLLRPGAQLHVVAPRLEGGEVVPGLLVLEPDYLVDITQITRCVDVYDVSPLVGLLHALAPAPRSPAILLGNLAGQLLDEELRSGAPGRPYAECAREFFLRHAPDLLATPPAPHFHEDARAQRRHIRRALDEDLPRLVGGFDRSRVMVEPSFFSSMLGLQGRMDFLQLDFRLLIEQKAGRGEFAPGAREGDAPRPRREHYMQLLLYMALLRYNFRARYERNGRELRAFLLYSRYERPLVGLGFAPSLLFEALRLRNQWVWHQFRLAGGGFRVLAGLTADGLNRRGVSGRLWRDYKEPELEAVLRPVREADDTERAYCFRMLSFVAREHVLSKVGSQSKENSGFASTWLDSLQEKVASGNIYFRLRLASPAEGAPGRVDEVTLLFDERGAGEMSNFRPGDIVMLYSHMPGDVPDACRSMVFRCGVVSIGAERLTLSLRYAQTDASVFWQRPEQLWAVEHDFYESSFSALYRGLHAFLSAPRARRDLLLLRRPPRVDKSLALRGDHGAFNALALRALRARELFLIVGPPGTGKTSFGLMTTLREELLRDGARVLVMAYTNRAVDEICGKLLGETDFLRLGGALSCDPRYRPHLLDERAKACRGVADFAALFRSARVVVGTTTAAGGCLPLLCREPFSLAIIDEASQILEPHLMGVLSAERGGEPAIGRVVMIGDHKQLPAVVRQRPDESAVDEPLLRAAGLTDCRLSLFERLLARYRGDPSVTYTLTRQGRMHPAIADFPNRMFYGGLLRPVPLPHQREELPAKGRGQDPVTDILLTRRVAFLPSAPPPDAPSDKVNPVEADMIAGLVWRIRQIEGERFSADDTVGVIVPYRNQIAAIRSRLSRHGAPELDAVAIDTVERFQGSQRRYIVYGFTVQRAYQLRFLTGSSFVEDGRVIDRKLNVAMTRAKERLVMVGNPELLAANPLFRELMERYMVPAVSLRGAF